MTQSLTFAFFDVIQVLDATIIVLDEEPPQVFETYLHTLLLGGCQQFVLERVHTRVETFAVEVDCKVFVVHYRR